ncbi:MAG: efflux RND transporter periplasmic adaptor subunit [Gemmatimonadales bacterium]
MNPLKAAGLAGILVAAGCGEPEAELAIEPTTLSVTRWTDSTELYLEHPALVAGEPAKFAVHLTDLTDFAPLTAGLVALRLTPVGGGSPVEATQETPRSPGIYGPALTPAAEGRYRMTVLVRSPQALDSIDAGEVDVYPTIDDTPTEGNTPAGISFLKEQQWKSPDFRTAFAAAGELAGASEVPGEIVPAGGRFAVVTTPLAGTVDPRTGAGLAAGTRVAAGTILAAVTPALGDGGSGYARARAELAEAEEEHARARRLVEAEAAPARRLHEAEIRLRAAQEALAPFGGGELVDGRVPVRSPLGGVITIRHSLAGALVAAGDPLFTVVDPSVVWVRALVPGTVIGQVNRRQPATIRVDGSDLTVATSPPAAVSPRIDPETRAVEITYPVANRDGAIPIGATVRVLVPRAGRGSGVIVPASAIFEFDGRPYCFVQISGESFEQRPVAIAARDASRALITDGVRAGERVVTGGGYGIRLASQSSTVPAHGHEH